jgi:hypothetical protein
VRSLKILLSVHPHHLRNKNNLSKSLSRKINLIEADKAVVKEVISMMNRFKLMEIILRLLLKEEVYKIRMILETEVLPTVMEMT